MSPFSRGIESMHRRADDTPTVFVVDDDPSMLKATRRLLRSEDFLVEEFNSAQQILARVPFHGDGCLLLDIRLADMNGMALHERLREKGWGLPTVFLTGFGDIPTSVKAMRQGATDFLTKPIDASSLLTAIRRGLREHQRNIDDETPLAEIRSRVESLSARELEVLRCVLSGALNKQIAAHLEIAEQTVKVHRHNVMAKMKASSVAGLVRACFRIDLEPERVP